MSVPREPARPPRARARRSARPYVSPRGRPVRAGAGLLILGLTALAAACGDGAGGGGDGPVEVRIALPTGGTSMANGDVVVADELGYFEEAGLEVSIDNLRSGASVTNGVVGGEFEVGGADIRVVAGYTDRLEVEMVVPADIQSVEDLAGRDLGIQEVGAFCEAMTRMVLEDAGMTPGGVEYVSVSADAYVAGLVQGQISSAILHPEQALQAAEEDPGLHSLVNIYEIEPDYFYGAYFVSASWLEENPEAVQGFAEAITRAHRTMCEERETVVPIIAEATAMEEHVIDGAWEVYMEEVAAFPVNEGLEEERFAYTLERMAEMETLAPGAEPDLSVLVDREPITAAVEELGRMEERPS